jgi:hypothetical protein
VLIVFASNCIGPAHLPSAQNWSVSRIFLFCGTRRQLDVRAFVHFPDKKTECSRRINQVVAGAKHGDPRLRMQRAVETLVGRRVASLTIPERALILSSTLERPLSPSQFASEWNLDRMLTARHFRRMEQDGFLRRYGQVPARGDSSRGRPNQLYCATANMLIRAQDWKDLPERDRLGHSYVVFITLMSRISLSLATKAMDRDLNRHFAWKALQIDRQAWSGLMVRLDEVLDWVIDAEEKAKERTAATGEQLISATVALGGFRSPDRGDLSATKERFFDDDSPETSGLPDFESSPFGDGYSTPVPIRALILAETLERPLGPSQFADEWGLDRIETAGYFTRMRRSGLLEKAEVAPARLAEDGSQRGKHTQRYSATGNMLLRIREWSRLSQPEREGHSLVVFLTLMSRISMSINARTLDRDLDRHFTWKALEIDVETWNELMARLDDVLDWVIGAEKESKLRMAASGEKPISATAALGGFRSPNRAELVAIHRN